MRRLCMLLACCLWLVGCSNPTPIAEIDVGSLVYRADDLPERFAPGPIELRAPDMLPVTPAPARVASVAFTQGAEIVGISTVLVYSTPEQAQEVYDAITQSSAVADLGQEASIDTHTAAVGGTQQKVIDLAVRSCRTVTHLRFARSALDPDEAKTYARTIDTRVQAIGC